MRRGHHGNTTPAVTDGLSLLTVREVAALLKVTPDWIYDRVEDGQFPVVRLGHRTIRFRPEDVREYLDSRYVSEQSWFARRARAVGEAPVSRRGRPRKA